MFRVDHYEKIRKQKIDFCSGYSIKDVCVRNLKSNLMIWQAFLTVVILQHSTALSLIFLPNNGLKSYHVDEFIFLHVLRIKFLFYLFLKLKRINAVVNWVILGSYKTFIIHSLTIIKTILTFSAWMYVLWEKKIYWVFFFLCFFPLRIMQPLLFLNEILSFVSLLAVPLVTFIFLKTPSKVFLRVIFCLPCFILHGGFHLKPFLGILFCSILSTYPSHLNLLCLTSVAIL